MAAPMQPDPGVVSLIQHHRDVITKVASSLEQYHDNLRRSPLSRGQVDEVTRLSLRNFNTLTQDLQNIISETKLHDEEFTKSLQQQYEDIAKTKAELSQRKQELDSQEEALRSQEAGMVEATKNHVNELDKVKKDLEEAQKKYEDQALNHDTQITILQTDKDDLKKQVAEYESEISKLKQDIQLGKVQAERDLERQAKLQFKNDKDAALTEACNKVDGLLNEFRSAKDDFAREVGSAMDDLKATDKDLQMSNDNISASLSKMKSSISAQQADQSQIVSDLQNTKVSLDGVIQQIKDSVSELAATTSQQNELLPSVEKIQRDIGELATFNDISERLDKRPNGGIRIDIDTIRDQLDQTIIPTIQKMDRDVQDKLARQPSPGTVSTQEAVTADMLQTLRNTSSQINKVGHLLCGDAFEKWTSADIDKYQDIMGCLHLIQDGFQNVLTKADVVEELDSLKDNLQHVATKDSVFNEITTLTSLMISNFNRADREVRKSLSKLLPEEVYNQSMQKLVNEMAELLISSDRQIADISAKLLTKEHYDQTQVSLVRKSDLEVLLKSHAFLERMTTLLQEIGKLASRQNLNDSVVSLTQGMNSLPKVMDLNAIKNAIINDLKNFVNNEVSGDMQRYAKDNLCSKGDFEKTISDLPQRSGLLSRADFNNGMQTFSQEAAGRRDVIDLKTTIESRIKSSTLDTILSTVLKVLKDGAQESTSNRIEQATTQAISDIDVVRRATQSLHPLEQLIQPQVLSGLENLPKDYPLATIRDLQETTESLAKEVTVSSMVSKSYFDNVALTKEHFDARLIEEPSSQQGLQSDRAQSLLQPPPTAETFPSQSPPGSEISHMELDFPDTGIAESDIPSQQIPRSPITTLISRQAGPTSTRSGQPSVLELVAASKRAASSPALSAQQPRKKRLESGPKGPSYHRTAELRLLTFVEVKESIKTVFGATQMISPEKRKSVLTMSSADLTTLLHSYQGYLRTAYRISESIEWDDNLVYELQQWNHFTFSSTMSEDRETARSLMFEIIQPFLVKLKDFEEVLKRQLAQMNEPSRSGSAVSTSVTPFQRLIPDDRPSDEATADDDDKQSEDDDNQDDNEPGDQNDDDNDQPPSGPSGGPAGGDGGGSAPTSDPSADRPSGSHDDYQPEHDDDGDDDHQQGGPTGGNDDRDERQSGGPVDDDGDSNDDDDRPEAPGSAIPAPELTNPSTSDQSAHTPDTAAPTSTDDDAQAATSIQASAGTVQGVHEPHYLRHTSTSLRRSVRSAEPTGTNVSASTESLGAPPQAGSASVSQVPPIRSGQRSASPTKRVALGTDTFTDPQTPVQVSGSGTGTGMLPPPSTQHAAPTQTPSSSRAQVQPSTPATLRRSSRTEGRGTLTPTPRPTRGQTTLRSTNEFKNWAKGLTSDEIFDMIQLPPHWTSAKRDDFKRQWNETGAPGRSRDSERVISDVDNQAKGFMKSGGVAYHCFFAAYRKSQSAVIDVPTNLKDDCPIHKDGGGSGFCLEVWFSKDIQSPFLAEQFDVSRVTDANGKRWFIAERYPNDDTSGLNTEVQKSLDDYMATKSSAPTGTVSRTRRDPSASQPGPTTTLTSASSSSRPPIDTSISRPGSESSTSGTQSLHRAASQRSLQGRRGGDSQRGSRSGR